LESINLMRLSVKKGAYAEFSTAVYRKSGSVEVLNTGRSGPIPSQRYFGTVVWLAEHG
jgi:hypothetical protein